MGRRVQKTVYAYAASTFSLQSTHLYTYNGWNLVKETTIPDGGSAVDKFYVWGLDLSQSLQGAGGVGGLLAVVDGSLTYQYFCDANGNVGQVVNAGDGSVAAHYEYDPFGNLVSQTGDYAEENPYLFSTKYQDQETDLYYYGYRFYMPEIGRWLNRDPSGESGGINLYIFVSNNPITIIDLYGLANYKKGDSDPSIKYDPGAGIHNSISASVKMWTLKQAITAEDGIVSMSLPDAKAHIEHYLSNTGTDYTIRLQKLIDDVPNEKSNYDKEIALAMAFVQTLSSGTHKITSETASGGYILKSEDWNWFYAVGGYSSWGKGYAIVCKGSEYTLEFEYKFADKYNWDKGKAVTIFGKTVTDKFMGEFHRMGLAKEFYMNGSIKKTITWKHGKAPKIKDGWKSMSTPGGR